MNRKPNISVGAKQPIRSGTMRRPYQKDVCTCARRLSGKDTQKEALSALQEAVRHVGTAIFDYVIELVVIVPEEWEGAVVNDMQDHDMVYQSLPINHGYYSVTSLMTLGNSLVYATRLQVISQGTGSHFIRLSSRSRLSVTSPGLQP